MDIECSPHVTSENLIDKGKYTKPSPCNTVHTSVDSPTMGAHSGNPRTSAAGRHRLPPSSEAESTLTTSESAEQARERSLSQHGEKASAEHTEIIMSYSENTGNF